jgi:hypothetical protein
MRAFFPILIAAFSLVGCESSPPPKPVAFDPFHEKAIYAVLKSEPVPPPPRSAYDGPVHQREAFIEGFESGWERAISGALLHGTFGTPRDLPKDLRDPWTAGWKSGAKLGSDRWFAESKRQQETLGQPDGAANRSQATGSETNRVPGAPGSGR